MGKPDKPAVKNKQEELPWDLVDRCVLPVVFSHALAFILAFVLNTLRISQVSSFTLSILFISCSLAVVVFYHNLKASLTQFHKNSRAVRNDRLGVRSILIFFFNRFNLRIKRCWSPIARLSYFAFLPKI